jgi:hypothetical protein
MAYTLEQLGADIRSALKADPGPAGKQTVCALVSKVSLDKEFIAQHLTADQCRPRKVLYEDPELGFTILAHAHTGAKSSKPHDHGPSWAIYGQADGETIMTDWECLARPTETTPGKAKHIRDYTMRIGDAYLYDIGVLHSPERKSATRLLRIEGVNMDRVKRRPYEAVEVVTAAAE